MADPVVIVSGARTAWAEYSGTPGFGAFKDLTAGDLIEVTDKDLNLLASIPKLEAGDNEIIVQ